MLFALGDRGRTKRWNRGIFGSRTVKGPMSRFTVARIARKTHPLLSSDFHKGNNNKGFTYLLVLAHTLTGNNIRLSQIAFLNACLLKVSKS